MSNKRKRVELGSESSLADKDGDGYIEPFNVNPDEKNLGGTSDASVDLTDTEVYQETHYYPFGMTMEGEWQDIVNGPENNYLYNGKELNTDFGLDWSDYGARYYDAAIGRWNSVDPMAEFMSDFSPYVYAFNDPLYYNDPTGMVPDPTVEGNEGDEHSDDDGDFYHDGTEWIQMNITAPEVEVVATRVEGSTWTDTAHEFAFGVANSFSSNNLIGPRVEPGTDAIYYGQMAGDVATIVQGLAEMVIGSAGTAAGAGMSSTGVGALVGVPVAAVSVATTTHGGAVASLSLHNLLFAKGRGKKGKGERNQTSKASGTDNPFKKMKPDPKNANRVLIKDANGKSKSVAKPDGFDAYWKSKNP